MVKFSVSEDPKQGLSVWDQKYFSFANFRRNGPLRLFESHSALALTSAVYLLVKRILGKTILDHR